MKDCKRTAALFALGLSFWVLLLETVVLEKIDSIISVNRAKSGETKYEMGVSSTGLTRWAGDAVILDPEVGIHLAKARGKIMMKLICSNPEQAIHEALSLTDWVKLPPEMQAHVEQLFSALANVDAMISYGDGFSETSITTELPGLERMEMFVYGRRNGIGSRSVTAVQGIRAGNVIALREAIFHPLDTTDEEAALHLFPVAISDPGGESVASLAGGKIFYFKNRVALADANHRFAALDEMPGPNAGLQSFFDAPEDYVFGGGKIDFQALEKIATVALMEWMGTPRDMYANLFDFIDEPGDPGDQPMP